MDPKEQLKVVRKRGYKRWFDIAVLLIAHLVMFPLWIALWVLIPFAIWTYDRGPIFYKQKRMGIHGKIIQVRKFRTMVPNAEIIGPAWTLENDERLTPIGKILRRTALDELPEILSVWKGDMSLVGPRALAVSEHLELEQKILGFEDRLQAMPGLTGLAQVYDRDDNAEEKFRYDMQYLDSVSLALDIKLLTVSIWNTVRGRWDHRSGKIVPKNENPSILNSESSNTISYISNESSKEDESSRNSRAAD